MDNESEEKKWLTCDNYIREEDYCRMRGRMESSTGSHEEGQHPFGHASPCRFSCEPETCKDFTTREGDLK